MNLYGDTLTISYCLLIIFTERRGHALIIVVNKNESKSRSVLFSKGTFTNYVTLKGGGGLRDALRSVVKVTLRSVTKGEGKHRSKKRYVIVERPQMYT